MQAFLFIVVMVAHTKTQIWDPFALMLMNYWLVTDSYPVFYLMLHSTSNNPLDCGERAEQPIFIIHQPRRNSWTSLF